MICGQQGVKLDVQCHRISGYPRVLCLATGGMQRGMMLNIAPETRRTSAGRGREIVV